MMEVLETKSLNFLRFLKSLSQLRRQRIPCYSPNDRIIWLSDLGGLGPELNSPFLAKVPEEAGSWLEVKKPKLTPPPGIPEEVDEFFFVEGLDEPEQEPSLKPRAGSTDADMSQDQLGRIQMAESSWDAYLDGQWRPWAEKERRLRRVQQVYDELDYIRRRIEEAEEGYELIVAVGLLVWRDPTGVVVRRHVLTGRAEISLDAAAGRITVAPHGDLECFRIELDMLEMQHQPKLDRPKLSSRLYEIGICVWDRDAVGDVLRELGNLLHPHCTVDIDEFRPPRSAEDRPGIFYAPALVLRERRLIAYDELVGRLLADAEDGALPVTGPWLRLIAEGQSVRDFKSPGLDAPSDVEDTRLYFPLPTNEQQRSIAERLRTNNAVLVKGPPGTGKSHTIANLICHLLARGERVLITAHASKALEVLLNLLPKKIATLCVTSMGSSREDQLRMEESVGQILAEHNRWQGSAAADEGAAQLEKELQALERGAAQLDRELREMREKETFPHTLPGGYEGTAAQIAQQLEREEPSYSWFPAMLDADQECPLGPEEIDFLADFHSRLTAKKVDELRADLGPDGIPGPEEFRKEVAAVEEAEAQLRTTISRLDQTELERLSQLSDETLQALSEFLYELQEVAWDVRNLLGEYATEILANCLEDKVSHLASQLKKGQRCLERMRDAVARLEDARVEFLGEASPEWLIKDARRRLEHFRGRGRRGWWVFAPRVVRQTRHVERHCLVNGRPPTRLGDLERLVAYLEFWEAHKDLRLVWPVPIDERIHDPRSLQDRITEQADCITRLLNVCKKCGALLLSAFNPKAAQPVAQHLLGERWRRLVHAEMLRRRLQKCEERLGRWRASLDLATAQPLVHPSVGELERAIKSRCPRAYSAAWQQRDKLRQEQLELARYEGLLQRIRACCPVLADTLAANQGRPEWQGRIRALREAWAWAAARAWLMRSAQPGRLEHLAEQRGILQQKIEDRLARLDELKAWTAFLSRFDDRTRQNLIAWKKAVERIGKGTGVHAWRHRRAASHYLCECIPKIPAWIMPLYRVWEMTAPAPGLFDTVIVDEASQAGLDALLLLLLAKRIVVVGDDMQNSPEAVGISEADILRLTHDHLGDFRFVEEFRPDSSLYDHAERAFGNVIALREHFRCVPEIIRFSNDLCYRDAPLIPLRQVPADRLKPLVPVLVPGGACQGEGPRILNQAEAEAVVNAVARCLSDPAYEGKTMGVIALQGRRQAEWIESRLASQIPPRVRQERKLRCGVAATFQGDQRDVIFLSLVVAPNQRFRALTEIEARRRFNVAMSRARDQVWLFHSVENHDLSREDLRYRLLRFFSEGSESDTYEEAERLERECLRRPRKPGLQPEPYESWFEVDVAKELLRRGYRLTPQFEVAGYRIDLVIAGAESRLAVECDGDEWHGPERYDHDLQRQRQLERAGWRFVRIRASEFYADRQQALNRIEQACAELAIRARAESGHEEEADSTFGGDTEETEVETPTSVVGETDAPGLSLPDPREAPMAVLAEALLQLIRQEGPLNKRRLFRLYAQQTPTLGRMGKRIKSALNSALYHLKRSGEIELETLGTENSLEFQELRLAGTPRVRVRPAGSRDLLEIPPSELMEVLRTLHPASPSTGHPEDALMRALLGHYRFDRLTANRRRYLERVIRLYFTLSSGAVVGGRAC